MNSLLIAKKNGEIKWCLYKDGWRYEAWNLNQISKIIFFVSQSHKLWIMGVWIMFLSPFFLLCASSSILSKHWS